MRPVTGEYDSIPDLIFDIAGVHILLNKNRGSTLARVNLIENYLTDLIELIIYYVEFIPSWKFVLIARFT